LVVEASSAGIEQDRVAAIDFDVCVFTNLSPEHVQHHHGLRAYQGAKVKLFGALKPDGWAVINADDPAHQAFVSGTSANVLTYGMTGKADVRADQIHLDVGGSRFRVRTPDGHVGIGIVPLPGCHNISNALAAIGVGLAKGNALSLSLDRLARAEPIRGRAETYRRMDGIVAIVDFAHNAASLDATLGFLKSIYARVITVFGCPGDGEHEKRAAMGAVSAHWSDRVLITSDNPKRENPGAIAEEIRAGMGAPRVAVVIVLDREEAIASAVSQAVAGDAVLVAGKGHEAEQLVGNERVPYSDGHVLRKLGFVKVAG
jgi:UDP-N-acetylmuramoyl-L-alanyl-D-glutamate--2,6-diaminopimelate ligase